MKCLLLCDKTAAPSCSAGPVLVVFGGVRRPVLLYLPHPVLLHCLAGSAQQGYNEFTLFLEHLNPPRVREGERDKIPRKEASSIAWQQDDNSLQELEVIQTLPALFTSARAGNKYHSISPSSSELSPPASSHY